MQLGEALVGTHSDLDVCTTRLLCSFRSATGSNRLRLDCVARFCHVQGTDSLAPAARLTFARPMHPYTHPMVRTNPSTWHSSGPRGSNSANILGGALGAPFAFCYSLFNGPRRICEGKAPRRFAFRRFRPITCSFYSNGPLNSLEDVRPVLLIPQACPSDEATPID